MTASQSSAVKTLLIQVNYIFNVIVVEELGGHNMYIVHNYLDLNSLILLFISLFSD